MEADDRNLTQVVLNMILHLHSDLTPRRDWLTTFACFLLGGGLLEDQAQAH